MATTALHLDPSVFDPDGVPAETRALNEEIGRRMAAAPDIWAFTMDEVRAARAAGRGAFPLAPPDPDVDEIAIETAAGPLPARVMHPLTRARRGTYLHFHGGGWVMGEARENDSRLRRLVEATGLSSVSVDYRLAPEAPYPAAPDDCEAAALWLSGEGGADLDRRFLAIGGESAGAHLAAVTLTRLRERHGLGCFGAAVLTAGCFDLSLTPSVRNWGSEKLILNTRDVENFVERFVPAGLERKEPDISPLHASAAGFPPTLLSCGTADLLIDDTLFMAARLAAAGVETELALFAGGCHVFQAFDTPQAAEGLTRIEAFLNARIGLAAPAG